MTTGLVSVAALMAGAANAQDFDGLYFGGSVSSMAGDNPWAPTWGSDYKMESDATPGVFLGFNKQLEGSKLTAGVELALQGWTPGDKNDGSSTEQYGITSAIDIKGRLGTEMTVGAKPVMVYGFAGLSQVNFNNYWGVSYSANGLNYGLGAEMKVSQNFGLGVELLGRSVNAYGGDTSATSNNHGQISVRAALHF